MPGKTQTAKKVVTEEVSLVGLGFRMKRDAREVLAGIVAKAPRPVQLVREQENRYDINAIMVRYDKNGTSALAGTHLGYLPADVAAVLAPRLDDGEWKVASAFLHGLDKANDFKTGDLVITLKEV